MTPDSRSRQITFAAVAAIWAVIVSMAAFAGLWMGFGGRRFAVALIVAAVLFGFELFLAVPSVLKLALFSLRIPGILLAPLVPLFAVLIYSFTVSGNLKTVLAGAAYAVLPALLLARSTGKSPGRWEDYAAAIVVWMPVEFRWMYKIFPYPPPLTHVLTILMALGTGVAAFVLLRRLEGIGYAIDWRRGFGWIVALYFIIFAVIAIPIGIKTHFLAFAPSLHRQHFFPLTALGIVFFTAWPEEFLFRGILQNLISSTMKNEWAGLAMTSIIFGLSHIFHAPYPNWKYMLLATIAGLFYGHAWMRTRSLVPGTLIHAFVDISWHILFR
ncbi:MAG TPA: type II CAAX endopeptidase family protein [Verrucomicrobiae bacterium]|nr:type II CAAX endopeptidase family protein [Verrucomicrobiae bacterium]